MISTLVLAAALTLQGQGVEVRVQGYQPPQIRYAQPQIIYSQPRVIYSQPSVVYLQPLRAGDIILNQRVGLFGWRRQVRVYRRLR